MTREEIIARIDRLRDIKCYQTVKLTCSQCKHRGIECYPNDSLTDLIKCPKCGNIGELSIGAQLEEWDEI